MKHLRPVLFLILLLSSSAFAQRNFAGKVVEVVDGKTVVIELTGGGKLTAVLQYIEVPEPEQPLAQTVTDHLAQLVKGSVVVFRGQGIATGTLIVGELRLGSVDISQQMLRDGAAWHMPVEASGQNAEQGAAYADNQLMAKDQKLGVWSVPGLKPAWEYRAEIAARLEAEQKKQRDLEAARIREETEALDRANAIKRQRELEARQLKNSQMSNWPEIDYGKRDPSTGLIRTYNSEKRFGITETGTAYLNMTGPKGEQRRIQASIFYIYFGPEGNTATGSYGIGFGSEAKDSIFLKTTPVTIVADGKKLTLKPVQLVTGKKGDKNSEMLLYKLDEEAMQNIAYADKLEVKLGTLSAVTISAETRNMMRHLMLARK